MAATPIYGKKKISRRQKRMKNFPGGKELSCKMNIVKLVGLTLLLRIFDKKKKLINQKQRHILSI